jgi:hypothetical protein
MKRTTALLPLFIALGVAPATAQPAQSLAGAEIKTLLTNKRLVLRSERVVHGTATDFRFGRRSDGGWSIIAIYFRDDGSLRRTCEDFRRGTTWPCAGPWGKESAGVWQVNGNQLCLVELNATAGRITSCYLVARAGSRYRLHLHGDHPVRGEAKSFMDDTEFEVRP